MKLMGIRVTPAAEVEGVVVDAATSTLAGIRAHVDCRLVDVVRLNESIDGWIDDEGLYTQERNPLGTVMAVLLGRSARAGLLHGPVLFLTVDSDGATRSLSPEQYRLLMNTADQAKALLTEAEAFAAAVAS